MLIIRRIATVAVMVYLLLTLLFVVTGGARDAMMSLFGGTPTEFWFTMTLIGAGLLLLLLLTENAYNVAMRRDITRHEQKVNELKAKLYDHQLEQRDQGLRPATTVPRPEPAPGSIARGAMPVASPAAPAAPAQPMSTAVPPPSAADLPPSAEPPTTLPPAAPHDRPVV